MSDTPYQRPHLNIGTSVEAAFDRSFSKPMLGVVNMVKTNSASLILQTDRGPVIYPDCRHKDDPWLLEHPDWIANRGHAIYDLSAGEKERLAMCETVKRLVPLIEQQAQQIAVLQTAMDELSVPRANLPDQSEPPVRRRAGRPRKTEPQAA